MKLSPKTQYTLAFWSITGPIMIPVLVIVILAVVNPFWFRNDFINWIERLTRKIAEWRDEKTFVKRFYDKAHLFDMLKA